ncbi:MAG TPA: hypothetical protein VNW98_01655 [Burkholderiaceae bacterium]|nr:hypothetical protein [Burkholderiaceae bacterium]
MPRDLKLGAVTTAAAGHNTAEHEFEGQPGLIVRAHCCHAWMASNRLQALKEP